MAKYIGTMMEQEYGKNIYHNFYPIAELKDNDVRLLTQDDQQKIFPESKWNNVGFKEASSFLEKDLRICTVDFETEAEEATTTY